MLSQINSLDEYLLKQTVINSTGKQAVSCLFRAVLEPVLELDERENLKSEVVFKVTNRDLFTGLLTRLEFSEIPHVDYGEDIKGRENLSETDFLLVATSDFISFLSWKQTGDNIQFALYTNCKEIDTIIALLDENSKLDLNYLRDKYNTSELGKDVISKSFIRLAMSMEEKEIKSDVIDNEDLSDKINYLSRKSRFLSHEIKNQLSICDLYSGIIKRFCEREEILKDTISHSLECITKSIKIAGATLEQLKSLNHKELKLYKTNEIIADAIDLSKVYLETKNIKLKTDNDISEEIFVDRTMFISTIVNLVKNASEAFEDFEETGHWVKISTKVENDNVLIFIENNAKPITEPDKIFDEGITTKSTGSGLGLYICKKNTEEQCGQLDLVKSDEISTIFRLTFCL